MSKLQDDIMSRKSVRTFDGNALTKEDMDKLNAYMKEIENPFGVPVQFSILDVKENGLSSPVIVGEKQYIAAKVKRGEFAEVAYGYSFERLLIYAWSLGIGTVWIGGTMDRAAFEKAMKLDGQEIMPCVSPVGYPAKQRSIRESMMRKGVKADYRKAPEELFFKNDFNTPMSPEDMGGLNDTFELVRWAPSAVNKQPWRIVKKDGVYHFYEKKDKGYDGEKTGDLQKIDVGIAICHFVMGAEEAGFTPKVEISNPQISAAPDIFYVASVQV